MSDNQEARLEPIIKQLKIAIKVEDAFKLFTEGMNKWWPLASHSVGGKLAETCIFEGQAGGRIYEVMNDGRQAEWGKVLIWEPFKKVTFLWYPGRTQETAQEVTVKFNSIPGGTLVELEQTGWEKLGDEAQASRNGYDFGWELVLSNYIIAAAEI